MRLKLSEIAALVGAELPEHDAEVTGLCVDSRKCAPGDLFCAVVGAVSDGHEFVGDAISAGAVGVLVTRPVDVLFPTLKVDSIEAALAKIAAYVRSRFDGPVVGVTGSVGKTTAKELIAAALSCAGPVLKSRGNQNTEYGLPMSWFCMEREHQYAVMEMGMRGTGHVNHLCSFTRPTIGVITAIGTAHVGELGSREAIALAKAELLDSLPPDGLAILPSDSEFLALLGSHAKGKVLTFGVDASSDVRVISGNPDFATNMTHAEFQIGGKAFTGEVPGLGLHQAVNAAAALAVCLGLGIEIGLALEAVSRAEIPGARLKAIAFSDALILADVYNSSPESCIEALSALANAPGSGQRVAILGDMLDLGDYAEEGHRRVGEEAVRLDLDRICVIGRSSHWITEEAAALGFTGRLDHLGTLEQAATVIKKVAPGDVVLVKGSRALQLEKALEMAGVPVG